MLIAADSGPLQTVTDTTPRRKSGKYVTLRVTADRVRFIESTRRVYSLLISVVGNVISVSEVAAKRVTGRSR